MNTITRRDILKAGVLLTITRRPGIGDSADAGDELCYVPATALATALRQRKISPVEVVNATAVGIRFRDVAANAGLGFVLENDPTPRKHLVETMAGGWRLSITTATG